MEFLIGVILEKNTIRSLRDTLISAARKKMETSTRIASAVNAIKEVDLTFWENTLLQRMPGGAGSIIDGFKSIDELEKAILSADWVEYTHPAAQDVVLFKTRDITGSIGVIELASLSPETIVSLDDRKNTGMVSATIKGILGEKCDYSVIMLGVEDGVEIVFTIHPGDPVNPSKVPAEGLHGKQVTVEQALGMGLTTVKIV